MASDSSGNGHHGTIQGAVWVDSKPGQGKALSFDGATAHVRVAHSAMLNVTQLTVAAWINPRSYPPQRFHAGIVGKGGWDMASGWETLLCYAFGDTGELKSFELNTYYNSTVTWGPIPAGTWTHVVATYDGSRASIFINGELKAQAITASIVPNSSDLYIGLRTPQNHFVAHFDGLIDDIRVYNRALTPSEIWGLYTGG